MSNYPFIYRFASVLFLLLAFWSCETSKKSSKQSTFSLKKIDEKGIEFVCKGIENPKLTLLCMDAPLGSKSYSPTVKDDMASLPFDDFLKSNHLYKLSLDAQKDKNPLYFFTKASQTQARGADFTLTVDTINLKDATISWPDMSASKYYIWLYDNGIGLRKDSTTSTSYSYSISNEGTEVFVTAETGGSSQFSNRLLSNDGGIIIITDEIGLADCDKGAIPSCDSLQMESVTNANGCIKLDLALPACTDANAYIIRKTPVGTCSTSTDTLEDKTEYIQVGVSGEESLRLIYTIRCRCANRKYQLSVVPFNSVGLPCGHKKFNPTCTNCY